MFAFLDACATVPRHIAFEPAPAKATMDPATVALRSKLVEGAQSILGKKQLFVRGRRFNKVNGNGVTRIYKTLERDNLLYSNDYPLPGDIIFWDNTYDADGDARWDDPLSHVGMVVRV